MAKTELVSLSLLYGGSKHAYAINALLQEFALEDWTSISKASIYNCLGRLEDKKLVEVELEKVGNMPERKVYTITDKGLQRLTEEMREALTVHEISCERFFIAILFGLGLDSKEMTELLEKKKRFLEGIIEKKELEKPRLEQIGIKHGVVMVESAMSAYQNLINTTDKIIDILKNDPDYYEKNMVLCRGIFENIKDK